MTNFDERRRCPRIEMRVPLQYTEIKRVSLPNGALTRNLSEGGASFVIDRFISLENHLLLEIVLPTSPCPIKAISKIAWIRRLPYGDDYEVGSRFVEMTNQDRAALSDSLKVSSV